LIHSLPGAWIEPSRGASPELSGGTTAMRGSSLCAKRVPGIVKIDTLGVADQESNAGPTVAGNKHAVNRRHNGSIVPEVLPVPDRALEESK
jgi:hypothetical protein